MVTQNPGLANPEISKIIGDHWRTSSVETKAHWKGLAEVKTLDAHFLAIADEL